MRGRVAFDPNPNRRVEAAGRARRMPVSALRPTAPRKGTTLTVKPQKESRMKPRPFSHVDRAVAAAVEDPRNWPLPDGSLLVTRSEAALLQGLLILLRAKVLAGTVGEADAAIGRFRRAFAREILDTETTVTN